MSEGYGSTMKGREVRVGSVSGRGGSVQQSMAFCMEKGEGTCVGGESASGYR